MKSNLEGTALNCVMAKKRDKAEKIFEILLNCFGSGVQEHQAMMRFEKRRQSEDETIDKFLDVWRCLEGAVNQMAQTAG